MHELSITQGLLEITLRHAKDAGANRVVNINLVMGQLSSVVDESVQFYWDIIAKGTLAESATLTFERVPASFRCLTCSEPFLLTEQVDYLCPHCGSESVEVTGGDDMRLESIDVE